MKVLPGEITNEFVSSWLADMLTKSLKGFHIAHICGKHDRFCIYVLA